MSIQKLGKFVRKLCWKMVVEDVFGVIVFFHLKSSFEAKNESKCSHLKFVYFATKFQSRS